MILTLGAGFALLGPAACNSSTPEDHPSTEDSGSYDSGPPADRDLEGDAQVDAEDRSEGSYRQGVYLCCGEGKGRSCCPPEMLPDPDAGRLALCFQYGGVRGECVAHGGWLEAKDICSICCPGLERVPSLVPAPDGPIRVGTANCEPSSYASVFGCTPCGNGTCDDAENECNCPKDCQPDAGPGTGPGGGPGTSPEGGPGPQPDAGTDGAITPPPPPGFGTE
jgi:hypothetical protein